MARSVDRMGADLRRRTTTLATAPHRARRATVSAAALAGTEVHRDRIRRDAGGDSSLSGVGRRKGRPGGRKVGAKMDANGSGATIKATGPVPLIAHDMPGHVIRSAWATGRRRAGFIGPAAPGQFGGDRRAVLNIPGIGYRRSARHRGTRGKDTWDKAKPKARVAITREMGKQTDRVVRSAFRKG